MTLTVENISLIYILPISLIYVYLIIAYKKNKIELKVFKFRIILLSIVFLYSLLLYLKPLFFNEMNISALSFLFFVIYCFVSVKLRKDTYGV